MIISDKKYACETCIKGHRSSSCKHFDRPLFEIKKKGRPVTQCEHCRELRKTKQVHVKCICDGRIDHAPVPKGTKPGFDSAAFPNGVPRHALETSVASEAGFSSDSSDPSGPGKSCQCKDSGSCSCCVPRKAAPKSRKQLSVKFEAPDHAAAASLSVFGDPSRVQSNSAQILARIAELRPVLPRPNQPSGPLHEPSLGGASHPGRHHDYTAFSPYERAYDMTHHQPLHHHSRTSSSSNQLEAFFPSACGCGDNCRCPGCKYHNTTIISGESAFSTCTHPESCSTCLDCTIISLQNNLPSPLDTALSIPQSGGNDLESVDEWLRQMMTTPQDTFTNDYTQQAQGSSTSGMWPMSAPSDMIPRLEFDLDITSRQRSSSLTQEYFYDPGAYPRSSNGMEHTRSRSASTSSPDVNAPSGLQVPYRPNGRMQGLFGNAMGSRSTPQLDLSMYRSSRMSVSPVPGQYANSNGDSSSPADYDLSSPLSVSPHHTHGSVYPSQNSSDPSLDGLRIA